MAEQSLHAYARNSPEPYTKYLYSHTRIGRHIVRKVVHLLAYNAALVSSYQKHTHQIWTGDLYYNMLLWFYICLVSKHKQSKDSNGGVPVNVPFVQLIEKHLSQSEGLAKWDDDQKRKKIKKNCVRAKNCKCNCEPPHHWRTVCSIMCTNADKNTVLCTKTLVYTPTHPSVDTSTYPSKALSHRNMHLHFEGCLSVYFAADRQF